MVDAYACADVDQTIDLTDVHVLTNLQHRQAGLTSIVTSATTSCLGKDGKFLNRRVIVRL